MGCRIASEYYRSAKNKQQALRDILTVQDYPTFFDRSRYAKKFASGQRSAK